MNRPKKKPVGILAAAGAMFANKFGLNTEQETSFFTEVTVSNINDKRACRGRGKVLTGYRSLKTCYVPHVGKKQLAKQQRKLAIAEQTGGVSYPDAFDKALKLGMTMSAK